MTYADVQPRGNAIKDSVLARRMPPWGAVKGFGRFRNDQSLTQEQIELITRWVDGGIRRGNNPQMLPKVPAFPRSGAPPVPRNSLRIQGAFTLRENLEVDGVMPDHIPPGRSLRIVALLPAGPVEPLVWLHEYDSRLPHPFLK
jgi:hypothetical protein